jgi:hypothetical protein
VVDIQSIVRKYIDMMPKSQTGLTMPMPKIAIVNALTTKWNGITVWDGKGLDTVVIKLQKRITKDEPSLNRTIAHEVCHAWAFWMVGINEERSPWHRGHSATGGWYRAAQIVNQHEGNPEFVTEFSDEAIVVNNDREFYVFIKKTSRGVFWAWFSRVTDNLARQLRYQITDGEVNNYPMTVIKTSDARFLLPGAKLPRCARPVEMPENLTQKIEEALMRDPLTIDTPRDIKTIVSQAKLATGKHKREAHFLV